MLNTMGMLAVLLAAPDTGAVAASMRATLDAPVLHGARWGRVSDVRASARAAYESRGWSPFWIRDGRLTPSAMGVLQELRTAHHRGLDPADYDADRIVAAADSLRELGDIAIGRLDAWLTVAATRYAWALDRGRVDPRVLHPTLRVTREPFDAARILTDLAGSPQPARVLSALEPAFYQYRRLQAVLVTYRLLANDSAKLALPELPPRLRPGMSYAGAPQLRRLLTLVGDLRAPADANRPEAGDSVYDESLVEAVRRFQRRHGFGADGIIGDTTRSRFARTFGDRVRQIELTLERWRWLPRTFDAPPILVNIPAFRLNALRGTEDLESEMLAMDVVVGTAVKNDTPLLAVDMVALQFHPQWNVPTSIMRNEIRPKALKDPSYLAKERYELLRGDSVIAVTDSAIAAIGYGVRVRQMAGDNNALGRVKFIMPNSSDIYLHDTPSRGLFSRVRRDFSHGCIRVADPAALAAFLLRDHPRWNRARVDSALAGDSTLWVSLPKKVPVFLVYQSAEVRESGETFFHRDLYGHDRLLDRALRKGYPYR
jgi:murein L,D-transpeptidase YcbB/YkuD